MFMPIPAAVIFGALMIIALRDLLQTKHAILRNFPVIGHFRYMLETIGPELRQYIVTDNDEERPFTRDQRRWVYASAKKENNYFGFGTDNRIELLNNYLVVKHDCFPLDDPHPGDPAYDPDYRIPCAKVLGGARGRAKAFRPDSVVNISGMSFGSLSAPAVEALNKGAAIAGCLHNTGEGGVASHHLHGGDLIWQIGTGYFGCRNPDGSFSLEHLLERVEASPTIRAIEVKLSQGAKPGLGGVLPKEKITAEIARIRLIEPGKDCLSPSHHRAFHDVDSMIDFIEQIAEASGLPVGIKAAVGNLDFWHQLTERMAARGEGPDFIAIDGGEGGTGAAPLAFSDHVALPFKLGFSRVYRVFKEAGLDDSVVFAGSGKLGFPEASLLAFALGCDLVMLAREPMLAIGCIQAQRCHSGHCPTGVATQNSWLLRGLDPTGKAERCANYVLTLRKEILRLCRACRLDHPALVTPEAFEIMDGTFGCRELSEVFGYEAGWGQPSESELAGVRGLMAAQA
ncbi:MAG: FMN-binding glutamate synthase family protein [Acidobacteriota bacterium]